MKTNDQVCSQKVTAALKALMQRQTFHHCSFCAVITAPALLAETENPKPSARFELQQKKMRPGESNRGDS